jgi:hypothetical protein
MKRSFSFPFGALLAVVFSASALAQPCPPPTTNPLQQAVNAAQPGAVILVTAGSNMDEPVCVTKPLTFLSVGPQVTIQATASQFIPYNLPRAVFYVDPVVSGVVAFQNLKIIGVTCFLSPESVIRGIYSASANATIVVDGCEVRGADYGCGIGDGLAHGAAGIEGTAARWIVRDSQIFGGDASGCFVGPAACPTLPACTGGTGGDAIDVAGEVVLVRTILEGGDGGDEHLSCCPPMAFGSPGAGGSAIVASTVWSWGSSGTGGIGGEQLCGAAPPFTVLGQAPNGADLLAGPPDTLRSGPHPQPGGMALLTIQNPSSGYATVAASYSGWASTVLLPGIGPYFLGNDIVPLAAGYGWTGLIVPVPNDPALVGAMVPVQGALWNASASNYSITNPDLILVVP